MYEKLLNLNRIIPLFTGSFAAIIGILVVWGWHTNNTLFIQLNPHFAGMQYNTAVCFIAAGIALWAIWKEYRLLPFLLGAFIMSMGYLTLAEYIYNINIGIDQFFMTEPLTVEESSPGRMSPNGALILSLLGTSIFALSNYITSKIEAKSLLFILMILSLITLTISFMAIFGYIVDMPGTYGWGSYTKMAVHTAFGNILLSIGLISLICIKAGENNFSFVSWLPWFIFVVIEVTTLSFWQASTAYVEKNERQQNTIAALSIKSIIKEELDLRKKALIRMANRWKTRKGGTPYKEWSQDALNIIADQPGYQSIEWVDQKLDVRWVIPLTGNEAALNINLMQEANRPQALSTAIKANTTTITSLLTLKSGHNGFLIYTPIGNGENFQGVIVGAINAKLFFDEAFNEVIEEYNIAIFHHNELIYQRHQNQGMPVSHNMITVVLKDQDWSITSWPVEEVATKQHSWLPTVILVIGFIIALMLSLISHLAQIARKNALKAIEEIKSRQKTEQQLIIYSKKLKKLSLLDPLTGIDNRRSLSTILQDEIAHLKESEMPLSVILLDVDFFKAINDTYGHVTGDTVLQKVGNLLRKNTRSTDTVARYGGEEFCIVLRNTTDRQAYTVAEKVRNIIADHTFYCEKKIPFHVTCSFGVYQVPIKAKKISEVFEVVDGALYTAKNSGRNCVVLV